MAQTKAQFKDYYFPNVHFGSGAATYWPTGNEEFDKPYQWMNCVDYPKNWLKEKPLVGSCPWSLDERYDLYGLGKLGQDGACPDKENPYYFYQIAKSGCWKAWKKFTDQKMTKEQAQQAYIEFVHEKCKKYNMKLYGTKKPQ